MLVSIPWEMLSLSRPYPSVHSAINDGQIPAVCQETSRSLEKMGSHKSLQFRGDDRNDGTSEQVPQGRMFSFRIRNVLILEVAAW